MTEKTDRLPPEEHPHLPDELPLGESAEEVWYDASDEQWWGSDSCGEFRLRGGSETPVTKEDVGYYVCSAVLKHTYKRYGGRRFCTGPSGRQFSRDSDVCKHHRNRESEGFMGQHKERLVTGAHAQSRENIFRFAETHKQIIAIDLYESLVSESTIDFEPETHEVEIDASDADWIDEDTVVVEQSVPTNKAMRAKALWFAALDFVTMESIREEQFREAFQNPNVNAVGETYTVVASGENGPVRDTDEHHLNLPLSRLQKDYEKHLEVGGVNTDPADDSTEPTLTQREYVLEVEPSEDEAVPSVQNYHDESAMADIDVPDD